MFYKNYFPALILCTGLLANAGFAQVEDNTSTCARLAAAYDNAVGEGKNPVHILSALESTGCALPEDDSEAVVEDTSDIAENRSESDEGGATEEVVDTVEVNSPEMDRIRELEEALLIQVRLNAQNEAAIGRISSVVYNNQIPANIRDELQSLSAQISLMNAEQIAVRGRVAQISELSDLDELKGKLNALQSDIAELRAGQAVSERVTGRMSQDLENYKALIRNFLTSQVAALMLEGGAGPCSNVSIEFDADNPARIAIVGSVWKEELRQAILDIPLFAAFQIEDRLNAGGNTLGCTKSFGEFEIALDPASAAPLLAGKPDAIKVSASLPPSEQCEQIIFDARTAPELFVARPLGFWVRGRDGFLEVCLQDGQRDFSVLRVTKRNDAYYVLLVGDRL